MRDCVQSGREQDKPGTSGRERKLRRGKTAEMALAHHSFSHSTHHAVVLFGSDLLPLQLFAVGGESKTPNRVHDQITVQFLK